MTTTVDAASNPFALMMDPESVLAAVARSERLARLSSRIWRPLDKPLIARADGSVFVIDENTPPETIRAMLTIAGREPIPEP